MKHFTPEYIKECDCKEIQNLSPIAAGDWIMIRGGYIPILYDGEYNIDYNERDTIIWLPLPHQLDDEIGKIILKDESKDDYEVKFQKTSKGTMLCEVRYKQWASRYGFNRPFEIDANPLIAKIKLLKELLNAT